MLVKTNTGLVPVKDIQIGQQVWSKNEFDNTSPYQPVLAHYSNPYPETVYVKVKNLNGNVQTIVSNKIHPLFVQLPDNEKAAASSEGHVYKGSIPNGAWVDASNLKAGYKLKASDDTWQQVVGVVIEHQPLQAYNLNVANFHTYYIQGELNFEGVWVHNNCFDELPKNAKPTGETLADGRKVYTTLDANGNEIKVYPGLEGRWYDLNTNKPTFKVDVNNVVKGSTEYKLLNDPPANSHVKLSNGTEFKTNEYGFVEEISFTPSLNKQARDARQTAVGKEGLNTDVGGHLQACSLDGTCDRFNLFPQDAKFNNSAYKRWENQIKNALKDGKTVNSINIQLDRSNVGSARPDSLVINYSIDGKEFVRKFINRAKQ